MTSRVVLRSPKLALEPPLKQFEAMYRVLSGDTFAAVAVLEELARWGEHELECVSWSSA